MTINIFRALAILCLIIIMAFIPVRKNQEAPAPERPNIVWLVTEDNSKHYLKLYDEGGVAMPNIERLAEQGIVFNHAFSQAAVCSAARSTIISGCYGPRIGAQYHRRMERVPMPEGLDMFPTYLRKAGYYTTNNSKEDYNIIKTAGVWDESSNKASYKKRKPGQPFFHVQNFGITHEGRLHFSKEDMQNTKTKTSPDDMTPFPYHPNTPAYRYTNALYRDLHQKADESMGQFIKQLEEEGLMENTFIFYYGDHGGVLPRSKGYIYESGVHVPMVVYVPEKWKHLVPIAKGSRTDAFVQFTDLAPTVLNLAGVAIPEQIDGKPFLGQGVSKADLEKRNTTFSYADRFDEKYDIVRALRKGNLKYMRNYQPFNIDALFNFYRYKMLAYQEWAQIYQEGKLNEVQQQFFKPRTPEALYDLEKDPHETNNLAGDPAYALVLKELRSELQQQVKSMPDLSFFPESYFLEKGLSNPVKFGQDNKELISELVDIADLSFLSFDKAKNGIEKALSSDNPWKRYWGLIVCTTFGEQARPFFKKAKALSKKDPENLVKVRAMEFLALATNNNVEAGLLGTLKSAKTETEANLILNTVALLESVRDDFNLTVPENIFDKSWTDNPDDLVNRRLEYVNK